jgi:hypothetical protein
MTPRESNVALDEDELRSAVMSRLTLDELDQAVVYAADKPVAAGAVLAFPHLELPVPWDAMLAFVDREPLANWGHSSRYLLVRRGGDEELSMEARLPPFGSDVQLNWLVIYKARGMPDTALGAARS